MGSDPIYLPQKIGGSPNGRTPRFFGADGRTRTGTACATAPSRQRVYQFHHVGYSGLVAPGHPVVDSGILPSALRANAYGVIQNRSRRFCRDISTSMYTKPLLQTIYCSAAGSSSSSAGKPGSSTAASPSSSSGSATGISSLAGSVSGAACAASTAGTLSIRLSGATDR